MKRIGTLFLIFCGACSTTYEIKTKPSGSKIFIGEKLVGPSPVEFSSSDAPSKVAGGILLRIETEGYQNLNVWLPDDAMRHELTFNITPFFRRGKEEGVVGDLDMERKDLYQITDQLFNLQLALFANTNTDNKKMDDEIKKIKDANPTLGTLYFLEAIGLLRTDNKAAAQKSLTTALRFAPNEYDFLALWNEVEKEVNGKNKNK